MEISAKEARKITNSTLPIDREMNEIFKDIADKAYKGYSATSYDCLNLSNFEIKKIVAKLRSFGYKVISPYYSHWIKISW